MCVYFNPLQSGLTISYLNQRDLKFVGFKILVNLFCSGRWGWMVVVVVDSIPLSRYWSSEMIIKDNVILIIFKQGFDEYMNLVLDDAEEVNTKKKSRKTLGMLQFVKFCSTYLCHLYIFWRVLFFDQGGSFLKETT